jgi:DNA-binding NtrC family response regulator
MNPAVALKLENNFAKKSPANYQNAPDRPTILIAAADPDIRAGLADLVRGFQVNSIWVRGVEDSKRLLRKERIAACLCGFWLQDGTYRELVRHLRRERIDISVIIVSAPACPNEYRDYLAAMNIGALDFLCYPYQPFDFERMLESAVRTQYRSTERQSVAQDLRQIGAA